MITDLFNIIDSIEIINLDERVDRFNRISSHLNNIGLNNRFNRFSAIKREHPELTRSENGRLGCFLSHCNVIENAYNNKQKYILVLEDDCEFIEDHVTHFDFLEFTKIIHTVEFDMVYLGATYYHLESTLFPYLDKVKPYGCNAAFCVIINIQSMFEKLVKVYQDEDYITNLAKNSRADYSKTTIDGAYNFLNLNRYATNPILATQHSSFSDIEQVNVSYPLVTMWKDAKSKI
jgi:GR25 family glycosyltransferase involved in LPS biosynthesis